MDDSFREGIALFNAQKFFECHEALEALWLKAQGEEKLFLHGLIQVAAALHHHSRRNPVGARSLLEKGWKKLERFGDVKSGVNLARLRCQIHPWREFLGARAEPAAAIRANAPLLPQIEMQ
jgi:predicted metal-dependent hydrolase